MRNGEIHFTRRFLNRRRGKEGKPPHRGKSGARLHFHDRSRTMYVMLTRLYCDSYKCLVNFEFRSVATRFLMGRNGAGKSTVFEVLELIRNLAVLKVAGEHE